MYRSPIPIEAIFARPTALCPPQCEERSDHKKFTTTKGVEHAIDCLNRTTGPPGSALSSFEALTGAKPKIMSIMPFGCTAYAVKPREALAIRSSLPGGGATLRPPTLLFCLLNFLSIHSRVNLFYSIVWKKTLSKQIPKKDLKKAPTNHPKLY